MDKTEEPLRDNIVLGHMNKWLDKQTGQGIHKVRIVSQVMYVVLTATRSRLPIDLVAKDDEQKMNKPRPTIVINEVVVHPEHRRQGYFKTFLTALNERLLKQHERWHAIVIKTTSNPIWTNVNSVAPAGFPPSVATVERTAEQQRMDRFVLREFSTVPLEGISTVVYS